MKQIDRESFLTVSIIRETGGNFSVGLVAEMWGSEGHLDGFWPLLIYTKSLL
jgi:hypothetical protein